MPYNKGEEACSSINLEISELRTPEKQAGFIYKACYSINLEISELRTPETQAGFIYRVHGSLRNVNSKEYEPDILAIGPYHHGKDRYKIMEQHKLIYLQAILNRNNEKNAERYISAIAKLEQKARNCYVEPLVSLSPDEFIKMLVLDGCFIIEFLQRYQNNSFDQSTDPIFSTLFITGSLRRDLILFENQIPFFVLCKLFDLIDGQNNYDSLTGPLKDFVAELFPDSECRKPKIKSSHKVKHILELIYNYWVPDVEQNNPDESKNLNFPNRVTRFIHSATELKDGNVKFKKRASRASLFEVIFQNGTMQMPPLIIEKDTECFFRNLIVYEQYFSKVGHSYVTNYVQLLDYLINSSKDVDILSECGIIESWLGDNEAIANIINKLKESVDQSSRNLYYLKTFEEINNYHKHPWNKWMAILNRDYFSSPWAYISVFAAFVLLLLTIIQTVCSIQQV